MAVDIAPRKASGAALGIVGIASYLGAAFQDIMNGVLIESEKQIIDGVEVYNFESVNIFWIGAAVVSTLLVVSVATMQRLKSHNSVS